MLRHARSGRQHRQRRSRPPLSAPDQDAPPPPLSLAQGSHDLSYEALGEVTLRHLPPPGAGRIVAFRGYPIYGTRPPSTPVFTQTACSPSPEKACATMP